MESSVEEERHDSINSRRRETLPLIEINSGTLKLRVTEGHPIVYSNGIKKAKDVIKGDLLVDGNGYNRKVDLVRNLPVEGKQNVINLVLKSHENPYDGLLLVEGLVVGDLTKQKELAK